MRYSFIIGLYNHKQYLDNLFESLEQQLYKDFEVIFCDDGSCDGTKEYFKWFKKQIPKFPYKYVHNRTSSKIRLAKSLNNGIKLLFPAADWTVAIVSFITGIFHFSSDTITLPIWSTPKSIKACASAGSCTS